MNSHFSPALTVAENSLFEHAPVRIEVLAPSTYLAAKGPGSTDRHGRTITTNSISAVVRVSGDGRCLALFPGDIDQVGLDELLSDPGLDVGAETLVFPHHGGRAGTTNVADFSAKLVSAVKPLAVVFSIGRGRHGTPLPEVIAAVRSAAPGARIACTQLSERCAAMAPNAEPTHLTAKFARGRERAQCCAGTMVISSVEPAGAVAPAAEPHQAFISAHAPSALCRS